MSSSTQFYKYKSNKLCHNIDFKKLIKDLKTIKEIIIILYPYLDIDIINKILIDLKFKNLKYDTSNNPWQRVYGGKPLFRSKFRIELIGKFLYPGMIFKYYSNEFFIKGKNDSNNKVNHNTMKLIGFQIGEAVNSKYSYFKEPIICDIIYNNGYVSKNFYNLQNTNRAIIKLLTNKNYITIKKKIL